MKGSTVSRRVSEFIGVALFAAALIWIVSLASYEPTDPVWFFSTGLHADPVNFVGRVGAFLAELSFQLVGYAAYLIPALMVVIGWHYFWCRRVDAAGTKATGGVLLFSCISAFLSLVFGALEVSGKSFRAGGYAGDWLARAVTAYLNRTGSVIVILTLIFLAIIMSTQFSFGRFFAGDLRAMAGGSGARAVAAFREWREERRREKQRREVIAKHTKKGTPVPKPVPPARARRGGKASPSQGRRRGCRRRPAPPFAGAKSFAPPKPPKVSMPTAPLPLAEQEQAGKAPAERRKGEYALPPLALLDAPKDRAQDRRARAHGQRAAARGEVPRVLGRRHRSCRFTRGRSSRPSSSSPTPA